jgi:hypothetical protein
MKHLALLILCCSGLTAQALELPTWQQLEFEQSLLWVSAQSKLSLVQPAVGDPCGNWQLHAESSVAKNSESVRLQFDMASDKIIFRSRLSEGKNRRYKEYRYAEDALTRVRREPKQGERDSKPADWPVSSKRELPIPALPDGAVVSSPYLLLLFARRALEQPNTVHRIVVHTDFNFYEVSASLAGTEELEIESAGASIPVAGIHQVQVVQLRARPLGELAEKPDFILLGLSGDISILYDSDNQLPLQLRGVAPRLGTTRLDLKSATMRTSPP